MTAPRAVVVGDLLYDMVAPVGGEVSSGVDTFATIHVSPGGSAANVASWLARLGVETRFVGRVGDDVFGEFLFDEMEKIGVEAHLARDRSLATGKVFVLVDGAGERTMITDRGASEALCPEDLYKDLFSPDSHLHLTGYSFSGGTRRETAKEALRLAREAGMSVSVDPSSIPLLEETGPGLFLEWTSGADLCFPNLEEGAILSGVEDPELILEELLRHYPRVVLKLGARGAAYSGRSGETLFLPAAEVRVVDTTGAGDALCAGFLSGWLCGEGAGASLKKGVGSAGRVVGKIGGGSRRDIR
ncbi:MAG: carbohydrate kinase family protein [Rubrobacteraceae bacterium]